MIKVRFSVRDKGICGFEISGHSGYAQQGSDIVCSAVSSAAYMAANTITDVIGSSADVKCDDGYLRLQLKDDNETSKKVLEGLRVHLTELSKQYSQNIRIIYGGVTDA